MGVLWRRLGVSLLATGLAVGCAQSEGGSSAGIDSADTTPGGADDDTQDPEGTADGDGRTDSAADDGTSPGEDTGGDSKDEDKPIQVQGDPCNEDNPWECHPLTNQGCDGGDAACDWTRNNGVWAFTCEDSFGAQEGVSCRLPNKRCAPGLRCLNGRCFRYCCSEADCDSTEFGCNHQDQFEPHVIGGNLGICAPVQAAADVCADEGLPWQCHPMTGAGCSDGEACVWTEQDGIEVFSCVEGGAGLEYDVCSEADGLLCAPGLACFDGMCLTRCCGDEDCSGDSICTKRAQFAPKLTGGKLGVCVDQPDECPWECLTTFHCDGVAYAGFACGYATSCCKPAELLETAGTLCPAADDGRSVSDSQSDSEADTDTEEEQPNYECQDSFTANETCPAIHFEMGGCPNKKGFCCELDPVVDTGPVDTDTGGGTDTGTNTGSIADTGSTGDTDTGSLSDSDSDSDSQSNTESESTDTSSLQKAIG